MQLSPNFSLHEFTRSQTAARRGIDNTPPKAAIDAMRKLCHYILEPTRLHYGKPVRLSSGYRSPALNRAIGGSRTSQHVLGEAADFEIEGVSNAEVCRWIAHNLPFDQIILEFYTPGQPNSGWVHVSYGPRQRRHIMTAQRERLGRTKYLPGIVT